MSQDTDLGLGIPAGREPSLAERLERCYSGAIYDVLRAKGFPHQTLPSTIRPLDPTKRLAGKVFTISGRLDATTSPHNSLLEWTGFLSKAPKDSVVVCQPNDSTLAHMGELSAETLNFRGIRGYIVDGGCRDSDFIQRLGFRVFCRYLTPVDIVGRWVPDSFGDPIIIGNVKIHSSDYIFGDRDGVTLIPSDIAQEVTEAAEHVTRTENLVRKAILQGADPQQAFLKYGKF